MEWWHLYLGIGAVSALLSAVFTRLGRVAAPVLGFVDAPRRERHKAHAAATPVLGGAAMLLAWLLVIGAGLLAVFHVSGLPIPDGLQRNLAGGMRSVLPQLVCIVAGAVALVVLGLIDDRCALRAHTKLAGQVLVAGIVAGWGVRVTFFWSHPVVTWALTTFWLLLVINAFNFFDNMDGLAAGAATIGAFLFALAAALRGQYLVAVLAAATCGTAAGFLVYNRPPASIFMGDAGSHFLGYLLAVIGALTTYYTPGGSLTPAPVLIPILVLGVPIFDLVAVVLIRLRRGQPIYIGDHWHLSHRLTHLGMPRAQAVLVIDLLMFAIGAGAVTLLWLPPAGAAVLLLQALATLAAVSLIQFYAGSRGRDDSC